MSWGYLDFHGERLTVRCEALTLSIDRRFIRVGDQPG